MTLDEIRLQQLLSPFQNQNTGVMSTNNALPFINTGQVNQNLQNQDLVNQIIKENMQKNISNFVNVPQTYYTPVQQTPSVPVQDFEFLKSAYEDDDEEQVEYLPGQEPSGIEKLFNKVQNIPGVVRSGLLSLIGKVNPALSFIGGGLSSIVNLPKFFQERRDARARAEAAERGAAKQQEMARQTAFQAMRGNDAYGGGGGRPGGFGQGAGDFSASDPTATEGSF